MISDWFEHVRVEYDVYMYVFLFVMMVLFVGGCQFLCDFISTVLHCIFLEYHGKLIDEKKE